MSSPQVTAVSPFLDISVTIDTWQPTDRAPNGRHDCPSPHNPTEPSNVLYLLEKYKRRVEWFHHDELLTRLRADSRQSEDAVEAHLREYLFDQGIDYPFSQPRSPGGRVDVAADIGEERPLILELKLFDLARSYGKRYLRKGFRQIQTYADDYGQSVGSYIRGVPGWR